MKHICLTNQTVLQNGNKSVGYKRGNCISSFEHVSFCSYAESIKTTDQNIKIHPLQYLWSLLYCQINAGVNNAYNGICRPLYIRVHRVQYVLAYGMLDGIVSGMNSSDTEVSNVKIFYYGAIYSNVSQKRAYRNILFIFFFSLFLFLLLFLFNTRFLTRERFDKKKYGKIILTRSWTKYENILVHIYIILLCTNIGFYPTD